MATRCDVCGTDAIPSALAGFATGDGIPAAVHVNPAECVDAFLVAVPEAQAGEPPREFAAARMRMDRLAELTGRPAPKLVAVRHDSGTWYWADDDPDG